MYVTDVHVTDILLKFHDRVFIFFKVISLLQKKRNKNKNKSITSFS